MQSLLEPLDVLCCNDIILPETPLQWKETEEILKKCSKILEDITNLISPESNVYCTVNDELKNFTETYNEIENTQKKYDLRKPLFLSNLIVNLSHIMMYVIILYICCVPLFFSFLDYWKF